MGHQMTTNTQHNSESDDNPWTTRRLLRWIQDHLTEKEVDSPRVCAELLVGFAIRSERLKLYMEPDRAARASELSVLRDLVARAGRHEPVQYLVGSWPFFGRQFEVAPCTLIPRPATEGLVELALAEIVDRGIHRPWRILDMCSGSGCIGVSIASSLAALRAGRVSDRAQATEMVPTSVGQTDDELPVFDLDQRPVALKDQPPQSGPTSMETPKELGPFGVVATDIIKEAVELTERNARLNGVSELLEYRCGSLYDPLREEELGGFDLICTNPPYVSDAEYEELDRNVLEYEPSVALRGGVDGLALIRPIIEQAPRWLAPGGLLLVEIGDSIHEKVLQMAESVENLSAARILKDHEGFFRILEARSFPNSALH
jgi:release factor glutamine methyltransferase